MRIVLTLLLLVGLAGCQMQLPGQGRGAAGSSQETGPEVNPITGAPLTAAESAITVTSLDDPGNKDAQDAPPTAPAAKAGAANTSAAQPPSTEAPLQPLTTPKPRPDAVTAAPPPPPAPKTPAHLACEKRGGRWSQAGASGANYCQTITKDSGKACTKSTECQGYCLAKSNTCAPATPLLGCHDILTEDGKFLTQCIN